MSAKNVLVFYHGISQPARAIRILLEKNKIQYTLKNVNLLAGEHFKPEYAKVNPLKKVPAININGFFLAESVAILRYMCRELDIAEHWYPKDSNKQAKVDEFLEWQHIGLRNPCTAYFQHLLLWPLVLGKEPVASVVEHFHSCMVTGCDTMENVWLKDSPYLCGDTISVADVLGACEIVQPRIVGYDPVEGRPKLAEWLARVKKDLDPFFTEAHEYIDNIRKKHGGKTPKSIADLEG